jgi:hypothetical protein
MTDAEFRRLLDVLAEGWARRDYAAVAAAFAEDVFYVDFRRYVFHDRRSLQAWYENDDGLPQRTTWHTVVFDEAAQRGAAEYTYDGTYRYHGVTLVQLRNGLISSWREYQHVDPREWDELFATAPLVAAPRPSGRPGAGEFADYAAPDIDRVAGDDAIAALATQKQQTIALLEGVGESAARGLTYGPDKWTIKEVVGHLADDERIFAYRLLTIARGDVLPLPGFDEKVYVRHADFEARSLASLIDEYRSVRDATLTLLGGLTPEAWQRRGIVNGYEASVRGLAFHIAGHELRHLRTLREQYLSRLPARP